ncbi:serine recombinase (plasmid) [Rhodococcus sp. ZPP]|uniref:serine recombinase n=1 Tax=Rhodococcus sp. ZPP TaxID=2749906 RepID=UPI001AD89577|nr:serine recombinase [Rhodococcus sp. ZPP]QTJ70207.1 serine recombinase [Rhodococcus sp. ZPP]
MSAATDRQWAVRDAVLRWLLAKTTEGYRSPILDADAIGAEVGWVASALTHDEVVDASMFLFKENYVTGVPVMGIGIPRPMLTVAGRRVAKSGRPLKHKDDAHRAKLRQRLPAPLAETSATTVVVE